MRQCTIVGPGGSDPGAQGLDYVEAVLARTDPSEQESVVTLPELDGLTHLPRLAA